MADAGKKFWKCWRCGQELRALILPLSRREECPQCRAELHVCCMCMHYDPRVSDSCREDRAEAVSDATRANFCDYFKLSAEAWQGDKSIGQSAAKARLEALFGESTETNQHGSEGVLSKKDAARRELDKLFGGDE